MQIIKAYYDGKAFIPTEPIQLEKNQEAVIAIVGGAPESAAPPWKKYFGVLSSEQCAELENALEDTERIDIHEW